MEPVARRLCLDCRPLQRRESLRRAGAAYRTRLRARRLHAARQARYRERQRDKFSAQKVTHHRMTEAAAASMSQLAPENTPGRKDNHDDRILARSAERGFRRGPCASGALGLRFADALPASPEGLHRNGRQT
ncbi:hypothetical protein BE20_04520 [Sorangium cellulosum]|nr:hypothetical protein BE20_04520 [Sorangium cellulosum]